MRAAPSLWVEQPPLAVVGGQEPHPHILNYAPESGIVKGVMPKVEGTMLPNKGKALLVFFVGGAVMRFGALSPILTVRRLRRIHGKEVEEGPQPFTRPPCHAQLRLPRPRVGTWGSASRYVLGARAEVEEEVRLIPPE